MQVRFETELPEGTDAVLVPGGLATPHATCAGLSVEGGAVVAEAGAARIVQPEGRELALAWSYDETPGAYPEEMFVPRPSRFTAYAEELAVEAREAAEGHEGVARARAVACAAAERFTYGHPEARFNDGMDEIPALGCGVHEGSCVDINTYFIAALRAAGIETGYVTGPFFPAEKGDWCEDGHCWVVTRIGGETQEWDIAHHLKMGTRDIQHGLNPKPGVRAAYCHSMGLEFPTLGLDGIKALTEPLGVVDGIPVRLGTRQIRLVQAEAQRQAG